MTPLWLAGDGSCSRHDWGLIQRAPRPESNGNEDEEVLDDCSPRRVLVAVGPADRVCLNGLIGTADLEKVVFFWKAYRNMT